jgi:hypothetical protein
VFAECPPLAIFQGIPNPAMSDEVKFDEKAVCEVCGRFGAYLFDGERLCAECYEGRGSCCPEFGKDDLWRFDEDKKDQVKPC